MALLAAGGAGLAVWAIRVTAPLSTLALLALLAPRLLAPRLTILPLGLPMVPPWVPHRSSVARILRGGLIFSHFVLDVSQSPPCLLAILECGCRH